MSDTSLSRHALIEQKRQMYRALLSFRIDDLTMDDIELLTRLTYDEDIQALVATGQEPQRPYQDPVAAFAELRKLTAGAFDGVDVEAYSKCVRGTCEQARCGEIGCAQVWKPEKEKSEDAGTDNARTR